MHYLLVEWHHSHPEQPVLLYSELDESRWEQRKVEIYRDGTTGFADANRHSGTTMLGIEPLSSIEEIATDRQFTPMVIARNDFEEIWARTVS